MTSVHDQLAVIARRFCFCNSWQIEGISQYSYGPSGSRFPFWICAQPEENGQIFLYGRVRTYNLAGCRTDLHDWIGALWAACCRVLNVSSVWVMDEGGFALDEEIYGRYLIFSQPAGSRYSLLSDGSQICRLFNASNLAARMVTSVWQQAGISNNDTFDYEIDGMPERLIAAFSPRSRDKAIHGKRSSCINYYRDSTKDLSFTDFSACEVWREIWQFFNKLEHESSSPDQMLGESRYAQLVRSGGIRNVISKRARAKMTGVINRVSAATDKSPLIIACDSHLIGITASGLCCKRSESGAARYSKELEELRKQHARNATFLNQDVQFDWNAPSPARFEELILEILAGMPEVRRVRLSGHCNEPDAGRDLIAEVDESFLRPTSSVPNQSVPGRDLFRIVVQCKTSQRNVGKRAVADIRDTFDQHGAHGFLLVAFPGMTRSLLDYVEAIRNRNVFWIDCWTKSELEAQLRSNLRVAAQYKDIINTVEPPEAK